MKSTSFAVETKGNKTLARIVQELLFSHGYAWRIDAKKVVHEDTPDGFAAEAGGAITYAFTPGCLRSNRYGYSKIFDAATQMGELIKFLEAPDTTTIEEVAREVLGTVRDGVISSTGETLTVGCSTVNFDKVEEIYLAMKKLQENK